MDTSEDFIWLLGATGYIGEALFRRLEVGRYGPMVVVLNRKLLFKRFEHQHVFTGGMDGLDAAWLERFPPAVVFHMARVAGSRTLTRLLAAHRGEAVNRRMVSLLANLEKPPVVVYGSGSLVYGEQDNGVSALENSQSRPMAFARYYHHSEKPWQEAAQTKLPDVRFARPGWIVGPGSWFKAFFWEPFLQHGMVPWYGDGQQRMSLIHIDDCAAMIEAIGIQGTPNLTLNLFAGTPITQKVFAETMGQILGAPAFHMSFAETKRTYGATTAMALTSSIPMQTIHHDFYDNLKLQYPDTETILLNVINDLKNHQEVSQ